MKTAVGFVCCAITFIITHFTSNPVPFNIFKHYNKKSTSVTAKHPQVSIMAHNNFMDSIRSFFGFRSSPPRNDFRNPIWSSDDEDDGDELYTRQQMEVFNEAVDMHQEFRKQMHDMLTTFGSIFGDFRSLFHESGIDAFTSMAPTEESEPEQFTGTNIRDYYLKPGYQNQDSHQYKQDIDLDGKISSNEISGLLKHKKDSDGVGDVLPFNGNLVPGRSFCKTIITTSVTKPDGSVETRRIIKNGNEVIEETTTTGPGNHRSFSPALDQMSSSGVIYNNIISELSSYFRNYY